MLIGISSGFHQIEKGTNMVTAIGEVELRPWGHNTVIATGKTTEDPKPQKNVLNWNP